MGKWKHLLSDIDENEKTATCAECGPETPVRFRKSTGKWVCKNQDARKTHSSVTWSRRTELRQQYSRKQNGSCALCGSSKKLVLDHCHATGFVRAALCTQCNSALGLFEDDPERLRKAAEYLERFAEMFENGGEFDRY